MERVDMCGGSRKRKRANSSDLILVNEWILLKAEKSIVP